MTTPGRDSSSNSGPRRELFGGRWQMLLAALVVALGLLGLRLALFRPHAPAGDPAEAPARVGRGVEQRRQGNLRGAADTLLGAVRLLPEWPEARLQLALVYLDAREYELARAELEQVTRLAPNEPAGWAQRGRLGLLTKQLDAAAEALGRALALRPEHPPYLSMLGEVYRLRGDSASTREAERLFRQTVAAAPDPEAYYRLGLVYQRLSRPQDAAAALATSLRLDPSRADAHYALSQVERSRGRRAEADRALAEFRRLSAGSAKPGEAPAAETGPKAEARRLLAQGRTRFYDQSQPDPAIELLTRARGLDPDNPDVPYQLGLVLHFQGREAEAEEAFRAALALNPKNPRYHAWIGTLLLLKGRPGLAEAQAELRESVRLGSDYAYGHYQLGRALLLADDPTAATPLLRRATAIDPRYKEAYYSLSQAGRRTGNATEAERAMRRFRELDAYERERRRLRNRARTRPDDAAARLALVRFLRRHGEASEARRWLEEFLARHPESAAAREAPAALRAPVGRPQR